MGVMQIWREHQFFCPIDCCELLVNDPLIELGFAYADTEQVSDIRAASLFQYPRT